MCSADLLRPYGKLKLTALEGCKLRRITVAKFSEDPKDNYLLCLTNTGDVCIVSLPDLRRFFTVNCLKREDIRYLTLLVILTLCKFNVLIVIFCIAVE